MASARITVKRLRVSYPTLIEPSAFEAGQTPKFSANLIADTPEQKQVLAQAVMEAATEAWGEKAGDIIKAQIHRPIRDGTPKGYGDGSVFINAKSKRRPKLVGPAREDVPEDRIADMFYPGCYVNAIIDAYTYAGKTKGVAWGLTALQWAGNGERLDSPVDVDDEFDTVEDAIGDLSELEAMMGTAPTADTTDESTDTEPATVPADTAPLDLDSVLP